MVNEFIIQYIIPNGRVLASRCTESWFKNSDNYDTFRHIISMTKYLPENSRFPQRLFHIIYNINHIPKCLNTTCNKTTHFYSYDRGYSKYCSRKCNNSCKLKKANVRNSIITKYGTDNISKVDSIKLLKCETRQKNYGDANFNNRIKSKRTCLLKYGHEYATQAEIVKLKVKNTVNKKYGVDNIFQNTDLIRSAVNKKYGVNNINQLPEYRALISARQRGKNNTKLQSVLTELGINYSEYISLLSDFKKYRRTVMQITNTQPIHTLENYNLRGTKLYHLDHKFSIKEGFINNINPYIIGNINNLEFITCTENLRKGKRCSILLEDLCTLIFI